MGRERESEWQARGRCLDGNQAYRKQEVEVCGWRAPAVVFGRSAAAAAKSKPSDSYDKLLQRVDL